ADGTTQTARIGEVSTRVPLSRGGAASTGRTMQARYHGGMAKNMTVRLDDELAADTEALARADGKSLNETVKQALKEAVERRRKDPKFKARVRRIIEEDRELLERLAR
ncbi:MAG TPA: ribbon-helix-helix protein, CopG family, partial [Solirubrobacteraceae bacterium]|nr:ribbon-helix-helix protein, CopG family [Solirubrobacteraceae bacterium]